MPDRASSEAIAWTAPLRGEPERIRVLELSGEDKIKVRDLMRNSKRRIENQLRKML